MIPLNEDASSYIVLISSDYLPLKTSAAVQMHDLALQFIEQGYRPLVLTPDSKINSAWKEEVLDGVTIIRLRAPRIKDMGHIRRTLSELILPFVMAYRFYSSPFSSRALDLIVWYSPTIFFGPLIWLLKKRSKCLSYLILRDIFPEWALDLGLLRKGILYRFFKMVANLQYAVADTIGVQTPSNLAYFQDLSQTTPKKIEVLSNWQKHTSDVGCSIQIAKTPLSKRKIIVYIGNMGVAQGMDIFIDLAEYLLHRKDIGFLFVGRGSEVSRLKKETVVRKIHNLLFFDEIEPKEMPGLLAQCYIGLIALDPRHKTHNIPGKFLTYMLAGIPVLARTNPGTDLTHLIHDHNVGYAYGDVLPGVLSNFIEDLISDEDKYAAMSANGKNLAASMFSPRTAVNKIIASGTTSISNHVNFKGPIKICI